MCLFGSILYQGVCPLIIHVIRCLAWSIYTLFIGIYAFHLEFKILNLHDHFLIADIEKWTDDDGQVNIPGCPFEDEDRLNTCLDRVTGTKAITPLAVLALIPAGLLLIIPLIDICTEGCTLSLLISAVEFISSYFFFWLLLFFFIPLVFTLYLVILYDTAPKVKDFSNRLFEHCFYEEDPEYCKNVQENYMSVVHILKKEARIILITSASFLYFIFFLEFSIIIRWIFFKCAHVLLLLVHKISQLKCKMLASSHNFVSSGASSTQSIPTADEVLSVIHDEAVSIEISEFSECGTEPMSIEISEFSECGTEVSVFSE